MGFLISYAINCVALVIAFCIFQVANVPVNKKLFYITSWLFFSSQIQTKMSLTFLAIPSEIKFYYIYNSIHGRSVASQNHLDP